MISAGITTAIIYYVTIDQGLSEAVVGAVLSGFALGSLVGSVAAARLAFRATGVVMLVGAAVFGGCLLVIAAGVPVPVMIGAAFVAGTVNSNILVAYITMRTLLSPDALLGRVGATARTVSVGLMPIGALTAGVLLDSIGGAATLALMGAALITTGLLFALLRPVRTARIPAAAHPGITVGRATVRCEALPCAA